MKNVPGPGHYNLSDKRMSLLANPYVRKGGTFGTKLFDI